MREIKDKIKSREEIKNIVENLKLKRKIIVTSNGCFDLLHIGHIRSLEDAKKQGDILIVGLNSDSSIKKYKGDNRPIIPEEYRAENLAALECVDYVEIFKETECIQFILNIKPDVHVKGQEPNRICIEKEIVEKSGRLYLTPTLEGFSTTKIIEKVLKVYK